MQALKGLVIGLGVLIIISFGLLIYGFYAKMTDPGFSVMKSEDDAAAQDHIFIPTKCAVAEMAPDGDRMFLRLSGESSTCDRILVIDIESGRELGSLSISR